MNEVIANRANEILTGHKGCDKVHPNTHEEWKGKIEVTATVPVETEDDLSLAYTPGVAQPCLEIEKDIAKSYELTRRWNLCLVVTDGSAVLGLGNIGPEAGMPVMEGKCVLFKSFGDVDAFPLCVKSNDVDDIVNTVYMFSGKRKRDVFTAGIRISVLRIRGYPQI